MVMPVQPRFHPPPIPSANLTLRTRLRQDSLAQWMMPPHATPFLTLSKAPPLPVSDDAAPPDTSPILHTDLLGDLVVPVGAACTAELQDLATRAVEYANRARGPGTCRAYRSAWRGFEAWCRSLGREPLAGDPQLLAMYAIRTAHLLAGVPLDLHDPRLVLVVEGITRQRGTRPGKQA